MTTYTTETIPTLDRRLRSIPPHVIVVHVNVGPETEGGAVETARFTQHEQGGYHEIVDDHAVVVTAADNEIVNGAGGVNSFAWHICLIGEASQTAAQWADPYSLAELDIAAQRVALACKRFDIPVGKINGTDLLDGRRGICGHADVSSVYPASLGHWDPGPAFPWTTFLLAVQKYTSPVIQPVPQEDDVQPVMVAPQTKLADGTQPTILTARGSWAGTILHPAEASRLTGLGVPFEKVPNSFFANYVVR